MIALAAFAAAVRVFSADYCADQIALSLAAPEQIAALSVDADKDFSFRRAAAARYPMVRADAEEVLASRADVVLRFWGGDDARLKRLGVKVVSLEYASDFDGVKNNIAIAAAALGRDREGAALIADIDRRLSALAKRGPSGRSALYVTPGGVTAGAGTMIDAIFTAAGVGNVAAEQGLSYWRPLSAEALVADPPDLMVAGFFSATSERVNHWSAARHPAMRRLIAETDHVDLATDALSCPGDFSLNAAEALRNKLETP